MKHTIFIFETKTNILDIKYLIKKTKNKNTMIYKESAPK